MKKIVLVLLCLFGCPVFAQNWIPFIRVAEKQKQMELQDLNINIDIMGNIATTTYDMTFFNPNDKVLEGEMIFPMTDNQSVVAMALDINGKMRAASAVDKVDARRIFEEQVRRGIDPALIEKVAGNQYKMRIYPFNPKGTRRIQITTEETLMVKNGEMPLFVPLTYNKKLNTFAIKVNVRQKMSGLPKVVTDLIDFVFKNEQQHVFASYEKKDYLLKNALTFILPAPDKEIVYTGKADDKSYFYSNVLIEKSQQEKVAPKKVAVVWDVSLSGKDRDIEKEQELLSNYLKKIENLEVELITFNLTEDKGKHFSIINGNTDDLFKEIKELHYDGATSLEKLNLSQIQADEILLFTDGIATLGGKVIKAGKSPVYVIGSAKVSEKAMLSDMANKTLARYIDLNKLTVQEGLKHLLNKPLRLIAYKTPENVQEIYPLPSAVVEEDFTFTGIYDGKETEIELQFGYDDKNIIQTKKVKISTVQDNSLIARQWATFKAKELELDAKNNRSKIVQLGKDFSILTEYTSFLVLDTLSDYLRYKVAPKDPELLADYNRLVAEDIKRTKYEEEKEKRQAIVDTLRMVKNVKKWWRKEFKPKPPEAPKEPRDFMKDPQEIDIHNGLSNGVLYEKNGSVLGYLDSDGNIVGRRVSSFNHDGRLAFYDNTKTQQEQITTEIKLKKWSPNTPYIKELRKVSDADVYSTYLKLRDTYKDMPAFYFDVSDEFASRHMIDKATLVLTNLLEIQEIDVELLRVAGQKLQAYKQYEMAEILFKEVIDWETAEPQGYRDLAILYEVSGQYQKALDEELFILSKKWGEFNHIKREVFLEMNSLIARHKELNLSAVDANLIFNMPVDLRITMGWSSRDKNVGLSVTDPFHQRNNEYYIYNGAKHMSSAWRFGPESYMIKHAIEGKYEIQAQDSYWDSRQGVVLPTFVWVDVYTHFGQKDQKHERTLIRMDEVKDDELGSVSFSAKQCSKEKPLRYLKTCTSCNDDRKLFMGEEDCAKCPNRKMFGDFCIKTCPADQPMQSSVGNCYECNNEKALHLTEEECKKCPNREMKFDYCVLAEYSCPKDKPLREGVVTCQSCDYEKSMIVSEEDCAKCPNREMVGKYCALKQCPADKPLQLANGVCSDCNLISSDIVAPEDCAKCPNREMRGKYCVRKECTSDMPIQDKKGVCHKCDELQTIYDVEKSECDKCSNRSQFDNRCILQCSGEKPLQSNSGECYSCDLKWEIITTEAECLKCPNREYDDGKCIKKTCSNDKEIEGKDGECYKCDYERRIHTYKEECNKCSNRYMKGEFCVTSCKEKNQIQDTQGLCYDCDEETKIDVDEKTCKKCPNRIFKNGHCMLPCPKDKPLMDPSGYCYSCDAEEDVETDKTSCNQCSNRKYNGKYCRAACDNYEPMQDVNGSGRCYDCDYEEGLEIPKSECDRCSNREMVGTRCYEKCPNYAPLVDEKGNCYTCELEKEVSRDYDNDVVTESLGEGKTTYSFSLTALRNMDYISDTEWAGFDKIKAPRKNCDKCPNLFYKDGYCITKHPKGVFMLDMQTEKYFSCSVKMSLNVPKEECDKCPNREMIGDVCMLKECPLTEPLQIFDGSCFSCATKTALIIPEKECQKCPNRIMQGKYCVLKK